MKGTPAVYLGRIVEKKNFRAFVYGPNDEKKVVNSWDEYEIAMQSGIWFASIEDAKAIKSEVDEVEIKTQSKLKSKPKSKVFEVTDENK